MFRTITKLVPVSILAIAAFAGGGNNDPILGTYEGTAHYDMKVTDNGVFDPAVSDTFEGSWLMAFLPGHGAEVNSIAGKWKKVGKRYRSNATAGTTAAVKVATGDPHAKQTMKCTKIALDGSTIHGRLKSTGKIHKAGGHLVKFKAKGTFTGTEIVN